MTPPGISAASASARAPALPARVWPLGAVFTLFLVAAFTVYFPSLAGQLLWDDAGHVTSPALQSWSGLARIWFEPGVTQQYYPLLHSAFWFEHHLWGDAPLGYHLANVLWHATSACLFVALLRRLAVPGAWLAGLLFLLHPVCVESVAWISEQKNTLSTVFYLAAALAWLRFEDDRRPSRYVVATLWFLAALLTKTVTATLPAALLVLAWWRRGKVSSRVDVQPLLPWFGLAVVIGLFTAWFEKTGIGAAGAEFNLGVVERALLAGRVFWFYAAKLAWPANLLFFYPRWHIDGSAAWQYLFPLAAVALLGGLVWWTRRTGTRGPLAAVLLFAGTLFPALGFVNVYPFVFSYVADHFQYLASLGVFALAAAGFVGGIERGVVRIPRGCALALVAGVLVLLAALSFRQSEQYVDSITLYRATLARNPASWVAHHNLGVELAARGQPAAALPHARRAVELKPDYAPAFMNLALDLVHTGDATAALPMAQRAVELQPRYADGENAWGLALVAVGRLDEAIAHFQRAIAYDPRLADAQFNLGLAHAQRGDLATAIPRFAEVVRLRPDHVGAELQLGVALALTHGLARGRPHLERALTLDPDSAPAHQIFGRVLLNGGELADAAEQFRAAVRLNPNLPGAEQELAATLQRLGR